MRLSLVIASLGLAALTLEAQFPIGRATPVGGYAPTLFSEPLWLGNAAFGYRVEGAPPGGLLALAVSIERHDRLVAGVAVYPDLDPVKLLAVVAGTIDANGRAMIQRPLSGPELPALAGFDLYAQVAVTDPATPGVLGSSQGLLLELSLHPMFAYRTNLSGVLLYDALTGATAFVTGFAALPGDAVFANGGRDLFVATAGGLYVVDTTVPQPAAMFLRSGSWQLLAWDRTHQRLYATTTTTVDVLDGDRSSPAFGATLAQLVLAGAGIAGAPSGITLSADGRTLALSIPSGAFFRFDSDPQGTAYLQPLPTAASPITPGFGVYVGALETAPDGRVSSTRVSSLFAGTALYQYDADADQWIDRDPVAPGVQPLSNGTEPGIPATWTMLFEHNGAGAWLFGLASVSRMALDLAAPAAYTISGTALPPPSLSLQYIAISPSGRVLVRRDASAAGSSVQLTLVEVTTLAEIPIATLPGEPLIDSSGFAVWR